jgi:D-serine deaminase-like pyridoxal phosphate-dependent protein
MIQESIHFKGGFPDEDFIVQTGNFFKESIELLKQEDIETEIISSGGTVYAWNSWPKFASDLTMVNECRPGGYIFYDQIKVSEGVATLDKCAARILTTIISTPAKGRVILDAGAKSLDVRRGYSDHDLRNHGYIVEYPESIIASCFEEHGIVVNCPEDMKIGQKVTVIPNYIMDNFNVFDTCYGVRNGKVEAIWPILARGKSQ